MVKKWSKASDWLPLSNALAQVAFWKQDLIYAENFLDYVNMFPRLPGFKDMLEKAEADVIVSRDGLQKARVKLAEAQTLQ
jgi:hypothetical protein